jgi:DNA-binding LacI/PurR family transcriptional regulator
MGQNGYNNAVATLKYSSLSAPRRPARVSKMDANGVLRELELMCAGLQPGDKLPTHIELMKQLGSSERAVRWALDELRRKGRIVRRQGSGTYVTDLSLSGGDEANGHHEPKTRVAAIQAQSRTIVAITRPDRSAFDQAMSLLFQQVQDAELSLVCRFVDSAADVSTHNEAPALGFIVFRQDLLPIARRLHANGERVVLVGAPMADEMAGVPNVHGDQEHGGYIATRHLLELGHRRIVFFCTETGQRTRRWVGHQRALSEVRKRGLDVQDSVLLVEDAARWTGDLSAARAYFQRADAPTGIVAWNDHEAVMLLTLLHHIGLRVPDDISLVGYDNLPEGQKVHPPLTTLETSVESQLQAALKLLMQPNPPSNSHIVVVLPSLIRRNSSAPIAIT